MESAGGIFYSQVKGRNIMTPHFERLGFAGENHVYELTSGRGIDHEPIYGVTIVTKKRDGSWFHNRERSQMFHSRGLAWRYIESLRRGV